MTYEMTIGLLAWNCIAVGKLWYQPLRRGSVSLYCNLVVVDCVLMLASRLEISAKAAVMHYCSTLMSLSLTVAFTIALFLNASHRNKSTALLLGLSVGVPLFATAIVYTQHLVDTPTIPLHSSDRLLNEVFVRGPYFVAVPLLLAAVLGAAPYPNYRVLVLWAAALIAVYWIKVHTSTHSIHSDLALAVLHSLVAPFLWNPLLPSVAHRNTKAVHAAPADWTLFTATYNASDCNVMQHLSAWVPVGFYDIYVLAFQELNDPEWYKHHGLALHPVAHISLDGLKMLVLASEAMIGRIPPHRIQFATASLHIGALGRGKGAVAVHWSLTNRDRTQYSDVVCVNLHLPDGSGPAVLRGVWEQLEDQMPRLGAGMEADTCLVLGDCGSSPTQKHKTSVWSSWVEKGQILAPFHEGRLSFEPTYRYNLGSNHLDTATPPEWRSHVWYTSRQDILTQSRYKAVYSQRHSHHRPVVAAFVVSAPCLFIPPPMPLSLGTLHLDMDSSYAVCARLVDVHNHTLSTLEATDAALHLASSTLVSSWPVFLIVEQRFLGRSSYYGTARLPLEPFCVPLLHRTQCVGHVRGQWVAAV